MGHKVWHACDEQTDAWTDALMDPRMDDNPKRLCALWVSKDPTFFQRTVKTLIRLGGCPG